MTHTSGHATNDLYLQPLAPTDVRLASAGFVAGAIWILSDEPNSGDWVMGIIAIMFFGFGTIVLTMRIFRRSPLLTITDSGISQLGVPDIAWSEVSHVRIVQVPEPRQSFIDIVLHDPEAYRQRMSPVRQRLAATNVAFGLGPAVIAAAVLGRKWPLPDVVKEMSRHHPSLNVLT